MKVAMLEVSWRRFEPAQGRIDQGYATSVVKQLRAFQAAGMKVTLGLGLHYTPQWVLDRKASRLVDQGNHRSAQADLIFNREIRKLANGYLAALDRVVGLEHFWAVRVTSGGSSELLYPSGSFWGYSAGAQNGSVMPTSMRRNPMPGWHPGQKASATQRRAWAHWYVGALADVADWQMSAVTALGFRGYYQVVTPGQGLRPVQWNGEVAHGLRQGLLGLGAAWYVLYAHLRHRARVTAYLSSVADGSDGNRGCGASDAHVRLDDPSVYRWSSSRWIARIAHEYGLTVAGESHGFPRSGAARKEYADVGSSGLLAVAMRQARSCHFLGLYWAHDDQVWSGPLSLTALSRHTSPSARPPADAPR